MSTIRQRITIDDELCNGKHTIRGLRITAQTVLEFLLSGTSEEEILYQYPALEKEDLEACYKLVSVYENRLEAAN